MDNGEENDIICLDESFFVNDNYQIARFTFGSQILELYCLQSASADFDLTGQMVWPGAELSNNYLSKNSDILRGCSVIELGSGVGITGILCSRFCREVVMTNHNDEVLKVITRNIELDDSSKNSTCFTKLKSAKLEWGNSEQLDDILQRHPEGFDLVLGADICFQPASVPLLFHTVKRLLNVGLKKKCRLVVLSEVCGF
ncbi:protein-lysine N-methyltransferase EFM3-like [Salvia splendens]|nr:protein-lysine N-methyltransferase EFM3-like [Salvia splendens]